MNPSSPNILFVIWDACRYDYARDHAPTLMELAKSNYWFEKAITPAPWSLPSHASLFTGLRPDEHGCNENGSEMSDMTLATTLAEKGYNCYGVSANGFACPRTGFHTGFDEYYYSGGRELFSEGLNVSGYVFSQMFESEGRFWPALSTLRAALSHDHTIKSLLNMAAVGAGVATGRSSLLQRIPHPFFVSESGYNYRPELNTRRIVDVITEEADTKSPFFAFANYMDTHRPYVPPVAEQQRLLGEVLSGSELRRLNGDVAEPWSFIAKDDRDEIEAEDVDTIRQLYAGEVSTVDDHLRRLVAALERTGQLENTIIIVTSDHGENLGEIDEMGRRRMGHESSISDRLAHVPLLVANPDLEARTFEHPVSLIELYDLLTGDLADFIEGDGEGLFSDRRSPVQCQYPAAGCDILYQKHPEVPREILDHRISEHSVAGYLDEWRVVVESTGEKWAWNDGEKVSFETAPKNLVASCRSSLARLQNRNQVESLEPNTVQQLEALGYL